MKDKINILGNEYKVKRVDNIKMKAEEDEVLGTFNHHSKIIRIKKLNNWKCRKCLTKDTCYTYQTKKSEEDVLVHEVTHILLDYLYEVIKEPKIKKLVDQLGENEDFVHPLGDLINKTFKLR